MRKRVIIYIIVGLIAILGTYIYLGMFWAEKSNEIMDFSPKEEITQYQRLEDAGAMSEESRQDMIRRLDEAGINKN